MSAFEGRDGMVIIGSASRERSELLWSQDPVWRSGRGVCFVARRPCGKAELTADRGGGRQRPRFRRFRSPSQCFRRFHFVCVFDSRGEDTLLKIFHFIPLFLARILNNHTRPPPRAPPSACAALRAAALSEIGRVARATGHGLLGSILVMSGLHNKTKSPL